MLQARLLGAFEVMWQDQTVAGLQAPRLQSVLAYLMLHRGAMLSRQHIAFTFWPDVPDDKARNNLRQLVHQMRRALPEADRFLQADASALGWLNAPDFCLDVAEYEASAQAARNSNDAQQAIAALENAAGLYRGDLLPGCYDDWVAPERERLRQSFANVLDRLTALHEAERNLPAALAAMQRRLELDPLHEDGYVTLMRLHALNDDRAGALRAYQAGVAAFKNELGIVPGEAMQAAHERLKSGTHAPAQIPSQEAPPLIGRQREWQQVLSCWQTATKGAAHFALIAGEAGIGKTRLAEELMMWASRQGIPVAHARAYAAEGRLSFAPIVEWLRSAALQHSLMRLGNVWLSEVGRILPEVFVAQPNLQQPAAMTDAAQRTRFFEALARAVLLAPQPLLLVLDDVQWCDQDTLEWLRFLLRFDAKARLLIVATCRTEEVDDKHPLMALLHDLRNAGQISEIELKRLDAAETAKLAAHILKRDIELSEATRLYGDTEGNPLFTVELARAGLRSNVEAQPDAGLNLPPRIHAVIASRLAQLSEPAMEVMQLSATVGRAFSFDVLAKASDAGEESLLRSLDELWRRRIVRAEDVTRYDFTHDKLREVAYGQISPMKRRLLHRRAAQAIEAVHAANLDPVSAQLAHHFEKSGDVDKAATAYLRAARLARSVFAGEHMVALLYQGIVLLGRITDATKRDEYEFEYLSLLAIGFGMHLKYNVLDHFDLLVRTQQLGQRIGRTPDFSILRVLATNYIVRAQYDNALHTSRQLLNSPECLSTPVLKCEAHQALGISNFWMGNFHLARVHFEKSFESYNPSEHKDHTLSYPWDPYVIGHCRQALTLWCLGHVDQASEHQQQSLQYANLLAHPFSLGYSLYWDALLQGMLGKPVETRQQTELLHAYSSKHSLVWWLRQSQILNGWATAATEDWQHGVDTMCEGMKAFYSLGTSSFMKPFYMTLLASLHEEAGQLDQSLTLLTNACELCEQTNERWYQAETHRIIAGVLQRQGAHPDSIEAAYFHALDLAWRQGARSFELRAATGLARLWQSQGRRSEARDLLQPIYDWFTEGFDTHDLKQAKALLEELTVD